MIYLLLPSSEEGYEYSGKCKVQNVTHTQMEHTTINYSSAVGTSTQSKMKISEPVKQRKGSSRAKTVVLNQKLEGMNVSCRLQIKKKILAVMTLNKSG